MFPDIPEKNLGTSPSSHKLLGYVESEYNKTVQITFFLTFNFFNIFGFIIDGGSDINSNNNHVKKQSSKKNKFPLSFFNLKIGRGEGPEVQDCMIVVNEGKEDELEVWGYKNNLWKFLTTLMMILMTGGLLGLILYWMKHYWLYFTQDLCSLKEATTVLVVVSSN